MNQDKGHIQLVEVTDRLRHKEFIRFPFRLHRNDTYWLPPLLSDEKKFYDPDKNKTLAHCDVVRFLVNKDGETLGRVMGIIHHKYNNLKGVKQARFYAFECIQDEDIASLLLEAVASWAKEKGMEKLVGPFGFSDKDPQGLLIEGFGQRAIITTSYNPPYYIDFIEKQGFTKEVDLVEYLIPVPPEIPEFYKKILERISQNNSFKFPKLKTKKDLRPFIKPVLELVNETFIDIYGFNTLEEGEMEKLASDYLPILDPELVKVITHEGQVVAFIIGMPDIGPGLQKAKGRLWPLGLFHIIRTMKKTDYLILLLGAIKPGYQGKGLDVMLGTRMLESASKRGFKLINSHVELETNTKVRAEMERMGGKIGKVYRIFQKNL